MQFLAKDYNSRERLDAVVRSTPREEGDVIIGTTNDLSLLSLSDTSMVHSVPVTIVESYG